MFTMLRRASTRKDKATKAGNQDTKASNNNRAMVALEHVSVAIHGDPSSRLEIALEKSKSVSVYFLHNKVCEALGLSDAAHACFTLVQGPGEAPLRRFKAADEVSAKTPDIVLRKWMFDVTAELALLEEYSAVRLLFLHAKSAIESGRLAVASGDLVRQLDDMLTCPDFSPYAQYVRVCQNLPGYEGELVAKCKLSEPFNPPGFPEMPRDTEISLCLTMNGLIVTSSLPVDQNEAAKSCLSGHVVPVTWRSVQSWSLAEKDEQVCFEFAAAGANSSVRLDFSSPQARFVLASVLEIVRLRIADMDPDKRPEYFASDIKRSGKWIHYKNLLFEPGIENPVFE